MGAIIDIVASLTLRAAIVLAVLNMTIALQGKLSEKTVQANMFSLVTTVSRVMSVDLNLVGNNIASNYFTYASQDTIEVCFQDPSNLNKPTWVKYFAGPTSELSATANPNDRKLYRAAGTVAAGTATPAVAAIGVSQLKFTYYDVSGNTLSAPVNKSSIKSFKVYLVMASGDLINNVYPAAEWTFRFFPPNIN